MIDQVLLVAIGAVLGGLACLMICGRRPETVIRIILIAAVVGVILVGGFVIAIG